MLIIRLQRKGKHKNPVYRVVINEKTKTPQSNILEILGNYNPHTNEFVAKADRVKHWISMGAQTSGTIHNLLVAKGIIKGEKIKVWKAKKKEQPAETAKPAQPASVAA